MYAGIVAQSIEHLDLAGEEERDGGRGGQTSDGDFSTVVHNFSTGRDPGNNVLLAGQRRKAAFLLNLFNCEVFLDEPLYTQP